LEGDVKKTVLLGLSLGLVAFGMACGGEKQQDAPPPQDNINYPEWVMKGSGAFGGDRGRVFYGVGAAANIKNPALLRQTADNRARGEIAKIFKTYTASLMKDYMSSVSDGEKVSEEQSIDSAQKTFTSMTLSGVQIVDHWIHPKDGSMYALGALDLEAFASSVDKVDQLSNKAKEYIRKNAEKAHMDLEAEEAKRGEPAIGNE
jgi:hypothetical protein